MSKIKVKGVYKIFGNHPKKALKLVKKGLSKNEIFEKTGMTLAVKDATFDVKEGEIFVIMGLSGSGKSTSARLLNRLVEPTAGEILVDGKNVVEMDKKELLNLRRNTMSMVFQSFALMPHMSIIDNACFGLEFAGVPKEERTKKGMAALELVGLAPYANSMPDELSGGMKQRVGLARALSAEPEILIMDEAFSALDPLIRCEMQDELLSLQDKQKKTIVFISHDLDEAIKLGDRIAIMEDGRIVQVGTSEEILKNPADDYVKAFFKGVDPTQILSAGDILRKDTQVTIVKKHNGPGPRAVLQRLINYDREYGYIVDKEKRFLAVICTDTLRQSIKDSDTDINLEDIYLEVEPIFINQPMLEIIDKIIKHSFPVPVVDEDMKFKGVISKNNFLRSLYHNKIEEAKENV